jgi:hypothetical protein
MTSAAKSLQNPGGCNSREHSKSKQHNPSTAATQISHASTAAAAAAGFPAVAA